MFDQIGQMMDARKESKMRGKYVKDLGWKEYDEDGDQIHVMIMVYDVEFGYSVFRQGACGFTHLFYSTKLDEAVEWAVDHARKEIANHEIEQTQRAAKS